MSIKEIFAKEGFLEDYVSLMDSHNLVLVEDFLKIPREAEIRKNTLIFGNINRLCLVKNKMKNNESFLKNAECVEIKSLEDWCRKRQMTDTVPTAVVTTVDKVPIEPKTDVELQEVDEGVNDEFVPKGGPHAQDEVLIEDVDSVDGSCLETVQSIKFTYSYLAEPVAVSAISSGYSIHAMNVKELADGLLKRLRAAD